MATKKTTKKEAPKKNAKKEKRAYGFFDSDIGIADLKLPKKAKEK